MMILALDTETTGFFKRDLPHTHPSQPSLVQIGLALFDERGKERASTVMNVVQKEAVPEDAVKVHGITREIANETGFLLKTAVGVIGAFLSRSNTVVAHHLDFDERIISTAFHRAGKQLFMPSKKVCTVELAEPVLKLPPTAKMIAAGFGSRFKKPNLEECYKAFFDCSLEGAHDALVDARAAARVYFHILGLKP